MLRSVTKKADIKAPGPPRYSLDMTRYTIAINVNSRATATQDRRIRPTKRSMIFRVLYVGSVGTIADISFLRMITCKNKARNSKSKTFKKPGTLFSPTTAKRLVPGDLTMILQLFFALQSISESKLSHICMWALYRNIFNPL